MVGFDLIFHMFQHRQIQLNQSPQSLRGNPGLSLKINKFCFITPPCGTFYFQWWVSLKFTSFRIIVHPTILLRSIFIKSLWAYNAVCCIVCFPNSPIFSWNIETAEDYEESRSMYKPENPKKYWPLSCLHTGLPLNIISSNFS